MYIEITRGGTRRNIFLPRWTCETFFLCQSPRRRETPCLLRREFPEKKKVNKKVDKKVPVFSFQRHRVLWMLPSETLPGLE